MTNPTSNYSFQMPTATDLVTDLPADFEVFGQAVDTRLKALQPGTTLGDLAYSSATADTNTRLGIGSTGNVLTVAGGVPTWAAPAGGGGANWSLLNAGGTALTGAQTVTVSGISGMDKIMVIVNLSSSASASSYISVRLNGDSASNYNYVMNQVIGDTSYGSNLITAADAYGYSEIQLGQMNGAATGRVFGGVMLSGCNTSGLKTFTHTGGGNAGGTAGQRLFWGMGHYASSSTISSVSAYSGTGNFDAGTLYVYGAA